MSTRSDIAIRLREADRNKTFKTPWGEEVKPNGAAFLYVYCHNDGYPDGVGADLRRMFDGGSYEEALEYILMGDRSTTELSYWGWRREECAPAVANTEEDCDCEEYLYILEEGDNGKMTVRQYGVAELDEDEIRDKVFTWYDSYGHAYDDPADMLDDCLDELRDEDVDVDDVDVFEIIDDELRNCWSNDSSRD